MKKVVSYILIIIVLLVTAITILGVWEVIDLEDIFRKIFLSLLVVFGASAVILFVYTVLMKDNDDFRQNMMNQNQNNQL